MFSAGESFIMLLHRRCFHSLFGFNTSLQKELNLPECQEKLLLNAFRLMLFERYNHQISSSSCCPFDLAFLHFLLTPFSPDIRCHLAPLRGEQVTSAQLKTTSFDSNVASRDFIWIWFYYFAVLQWAGWHGG